MAEPGFTAAEAALLRVEWSLAVTADDTALLFERACLLDRLGRADAARQAYLDVIARDADHEAALVRLGALLLAQRFTSAGRTALERAVALNPGNLAARLHLATLLRLMEQPELARGEYEAALRIDPACRAAHQGLAYLLDEADPVRAERHRRAGFEGAALETARYRGAAPPVVVLRLVSARGGNIPLDEVLDDRMFLVHTVVAEFAAPDLVLPEHDVVFNAIGDADRCGDSLRALPALLSRSPARVVNPPALVGQTTRAGSYRRLARLPGLIVPRCEDVSRPALQGAPPLGYRYPFLLRTPGFHTGQHFRRVGTGAELQAALAELPGETLQAIEYIDTGAADGRFRKYRVMFIGGRALPLHLAIATSWKVHHFTAGMAGDEAARAEEARFLGDMAGVLGPAAMAALDAVQAAVGLDYAGVDFALAADGRPVVFEANAAMTIAPPLAGEMWDYRRPAALRAVAAAQSLLRAAAARPGGPARLATGTELG